MKRFELKELGFDNSEILEVIEELRLESDDFEVNNYRFISEDSIDSIMQDELSGDEYILGCFNSWFLADVLDIDCDVIEAMQEAEAFEAIGKLVLSMNKLEELQSKYVSADGYGHHFARYDGNKYELKLNGRDFYAFRVN